MKSIIDRQVEREMKKYYARQEQIRGWRVINDAEIREQLYLRGKAYEQEAWSSVRTLLIAIGIVLVLSIFFPFLLEVAIVFAFWSLIVIPRYLKFRIRTSNFQKNGVYQTEELKLEGYERPTTVHMIGINSGVKVHFYYDFKLKPTQKVMMYVTTIPACMIAVIDEDGTGTWHDIPEKEDSDWKKQVK